MCGINGVLQFRRFLNTDRLKSIIREMNAGILHRGPDDEGFYCDDICALGMRRLSIIDLKTGSQPIYTLKRDKVIIYNGELYNYTSLKKELLSLGHEFYTDSDTEIVLHGFDEWGTDFLPRMEGMFAFAVYDINTGRLTLARDKIGEKPLYYYLCGDFCVFGSEMKSLLASGLIPKEIDREALSQYMQLTYIPAPKSIIVGVKKLLPATVMTIEATGKTSTKTYWDIEINPDMQDYDMCKKMLRDALFHSVEQRMISDVPLGAFLSGGFDSTIISGIMSRISAKPVNAFTIGFHDKHYDESSLATLSARKNHLNHEVIMFDDNSLTSEIDTVLNNIDEPFADSSLIVTYAVSKAARQFVKVVLTGDAGDELFAGYNKYLISYYGKKYRKIPAIFRKGIIEPATKLLPSRTGLARKVRKVINASDSDDFTQRKKLMSLGFQEQDITSLMSDGNVAPMEFIREYYDRLTNADDQLRAQYVDMKILLEGDMLTKVDRASMLASLETRVAMLDTEVIELAFSIPTRYKIDGKKRKIILKDAFKDMIPDELFRAPKHGFTVPMSEWLDTILKARLMDYARPEYLEAQGIFNAWYIDRIITEHISHKRDWSNELWTFFVFQDWYRRYID